VSEWQEIERAVSEEVLRQMPAAVLIAVAPSGETILLNRRTQQMSEQYLGQSELSGVEALRDLHDSGVFELFRPDGRPYQFEEWPVMRSITSGEEVRDEDVIQVMADATRLTIRCNSSPIYNEEGRIVAGVLVAQDITKQKRAEKELRDAHRRIEGILQSITDAYYALDREWHFTYINERALHYLEGVKGDDLTREDLLARNIWEAFPEAVGSVFYEKYHEAMREQKPVEFETYSPWSNRWIEVHAYPSEEGLAVYFRNITERKRAEQEIERRTHQQAVVADLGLRALMHDDLQALMNEAVALVAQTLAVEYAKIVELLPGGEELLLRAGVGWREGLVGEARERAGLGSQAGYTALVSSEAVIVEDLGEETRFEPPPLLVEHGVVSGMTVVIPSTEGPYGMLGAHTTSHRSFSEDDINFLQAVANVLATAKERTEAREGYGSREKPHSTGSPR
jgi:PAS domain S-box-containing protein